MAPPRRILLVEDEPTLQRILGSVLSDAGHSVETVATAEAAIEMVDDTGAPDIDLVLSDKNLPGLNGLDLLRHVRTCPPDAAPSAFVLVTGYPSRDSALDVLAQGGDGYMVKPFRSLVHAIQDIEGILARPKGRARAAFLLASHVHDALAADGALSSDVQTALLVDDEALRARLVDRLHALEQTPRDVAALRGSTLPVALIAGRVEDLARFRESNPDAALLLVDGAPAFNDIVTLIQQGGARVVDPMRIGAPR
jgi:CheY-like chemotaxis protein